MGFLGIEGAWRLLIVFLGPLNLEELLRTIRDHPKFHHFLKVFKNFRKIPSKKSKTKIFKNPFKISRSKQLINWI
jgi:hypothetical protein